MIRAYSLGTPEAIVIICFDEDLADDLAAEYDLNVEIVDIDDSTLLYT